MKQVLDDIKKWADFAPVNKKSLNASIRDNLLKLEKIIKNFSSILERTMLKYYAYQKFQSFSW